MIMVRLKAKKGEKRGRKRETLGGQRDMEACNVEGLGGGASRTQNPAKVL